jgi:rhodanese-related sulfurtransferase
MSLQYKSQVRATPAAESTMAQEHFQQKLQFETDASDVQFDMAQGVQDFVVVDVRSAAHYQAGHIPGAAHIPHAQITRTRIEAQYPPETLFVVYCWGPGCNGSTKGALRFSELGYAVKELIGGIEYWQREGYAVETGA